MLVALVRKLQALLAQARAQETPNTPHPSYADGLAEALSLAGKVPPDYPTREQLLERIRRLRQDYRTFVPGSMDLREDLRLATLPETPKPPFDWGDKRLTAADTGKRITFYWRNGVSLDRRPYRATICSATEDTVTLSVNGMVWRAVHEIGLYIYLDPGSLED